MGPSERGRDPGYEVLPVSVEALFRDLRRSQGRSASTLKVMRGKEEAKMKKKKKNQAHVSNKWNGREAR